MPSLEPVYIYMNIYTYIICYTVNSPPDRTCVPIALRGVLTVLTTPNRKRRINVLAP